MERRSKVVSDLIEQLEKKLSGKDVKASLGDYIRLVQLQKELEEDEVREIKVQWVEPAAARTEMEEQTGGLDPEETPAESPAKRKRSARPKTGPQVSKK